MHPDGRTRPRLGTATNRLYRWLAVLFPFSIAGSVFGQNYLTPPAGFQGAPAVPTMGSVSTTGGTTDAQLRSQMIEQLNAQLNAQPTGQPGAEANGGPNAEANAPGTPQMGVAATTPLIAPMDNLMQWGMLHLHARASYQFLYSTGVHSEPGQASDTITHTVTPGLTFNVGPHVTLDYSPSIRFFSEKNFHNTVDQAASLAAHFEYGDWHFGITQNFSATDEPLVQTSSQTDQKDFAAGVVAVYQVNDRISLETGGNVSLTYLGGSTNVFVGHGTNAVPSELSDSQSYSGSETLDYKISDKISTGVGGSVSYGTQDSGFRSLNENLNAHLDWHPGSKLTASVSVGVQHRDFLSSSGTDDWTPTYSANVGYHIFEQTSLSFYANRSAGASLFQNQAVDGTSIGVGLQQRLVGKLQLTLGYGYTKSEYQSTTANLATSRSDEGSSFSAGLSMAFLKRCNVATFYNYNQNSSSSTGFGFASNQVGASLSWTY